MYLRPKHAWVKHLDFMFADIVCLNLAYILAFYIRFRLDDFTAVPKDYTGLLLMINCIEVIVSGVTGNLSEVLHRGKFIELEHVAALSGITFLVTTCAMFVVHNSGIYSRLLVVFLFSIFIVLDLPVRLVMKSILLKRLHSVARNTYDGRSLFLVTEKKNLEEILHEIQDEYLERFNVGGILLLNSPGAETEEYKGIRVFTEEDAASRFICRKWIDEVFLFTEDRAHIPDRFIEQCREMAVTVHYALDLQNVEHNKQFVERLGDRTVLTTAYNYITLPQAFVKRLFDIFAGFFGCVFTVLIGIIIAPFLYIKSPGPILFKQTRIGRNGRQFIRFKNRTVGTENLSPYFAA